MQKYSDTGIQPQLQTHSYPVTIHMPEKNPAQEDDDNLRMAVMLKKLMQQPHENPRRNRYADSGI